MSNAGICEDCGNRTDWLYYSRAEKKSIRASEGKRNI
jgi:hypothetical protein